MKAAASSVMVNSRDRPRSAIAAVHLSDTSMATSLENTMNGLQFVVGQHRVICAVLLAVVRRMSNQVDIVHGTQMALLEMNEKLNRILLAIGALETRIGEVELSRGDQFNPPRPPKPLSPSATKFPETIPEDPRIYDEVKPPPPLPYRKKGKFLTTKQCELMISEMQVIKSYVADTKTKQKDEKMKVMGLIGSMIKTMQPETLQS